MEKFYYPQCQGKRNNIIKPVKRIQYAGICHHEGNDSFETQINF